MPFPIPRLASPPRLRASPMGPLDSPGLAAGSRYDPHPPPPHHLVNSDYYSRQSHRHHHGPFPSPPLPCPPPYSDHLARSLRREREPRLLPVDDGGRLRVPYPQDPFPQPPLRVLDRSPLLDDRYPSPRLHLMGHGQRFVHDSPESRAFDADRFRVVEESQDLLRMRWEDEEKRRVLAYSRDNVYREDFDGGLARRKRLRRMEGTELEEHLGGPSKSHIRVWDTEIDHGHHVLLPVPSVIPAHAWSPRAPCHFAAIDGKREVASVAEWQNLLPPMKSYSNKHREERRGERPPQLPFYSDRNRDKGRDREDVRELGPVLERHLRTPFPTIRSPGNSYSDINKDFGTSSDVYDEPTTGTVYSYQTNYFGDNRGKRKLSNRESDEIIMRSSGKQSAKRPSAKLFNKGNDQIVISSPGKQPAKRPSALSRIQSGVSVWSRLQDKTLVDTPPPESVSQPTTFIKHHSELSTPYFSLKSNSLIGEASSPRSALLSSDGKGCERSTPKKVVKKKLVRKGEEFATPVVSASVVPEEKDGISKMLMLNNQKKMDDPEVSDKQGISSMKDVNNASLQNSSRRAASTMSIDENIGEVLIDENLGEGKEILLSVGGRKVKGRSCIIEKQEIELASCANLDPCCSEFIDTETAVKKSVSIDPSRYAEEEKGKQFVELGQTVNQNCANGIVDSGVVNNSSSSPINHVNIEGKVDKETGQLSSVLQAQNAMDENHDNQNFDGLDDGLKSGDFGRGFVAYSSKYSSSPLRDSEQLVMSVGHITSSLTSYSIIDDNLKKEQHTVGMQHVEINAHAKELKEISGGNCMTDKGYLCMEPQNLSGDLPPQLMNAVSGGYRPDITIDEKGNSLASLSNVESPQYDSLKPREEDLVASSFFMSEVQDVSPCIASEQPHSGFPDRCGCCEDGLIKDGSNQDQKAIIEDKYLLAFRGSSAAKVEGVTSAENISCKPMFDKEISFLSDDTVKQKTPESRDMNRQEQLNQKTMPTVGLLKDSPIRANSVNSSKETTRARQSLRHKTWHRKDAPSSTFMGILQCQKGGSLSKLSPRKLGKIQNSYVRKGNSLIRKPPAGPLQPSHSLGSSRKLSKDITEKSIVFGSNDSTNNIRTCPNSSFESKLSTEPTQPSQSMGYTSKFNKDFTEKSSSGNNILNCSNPYFERLKTPPLSLVSKLSNSTMDLSSEVPHALLENSVPEAMTDVQDTPLILPSVDNQNVMRDKICEPLGKRMIYVKHRSNQLVAASPHKVKDSVASSASSEFYYKKNKNQLVRNVYSSEGQSSDILPGNGSMGEQKVSISTANGVASSVLKKKSNKAQHKQHKYSSFSHVWTLSGKKPSKKGVASFSHMEVLPYLLPWKRATLLRSHKLQLARKKDALYTLSADGFSLKNGGVSRLGKSSLKWSRSMQRRSKVVNKEAELAVAEVEKNNRGQDNLPSVSGRKHNITSLNEQLRGGDAGLGNDSISSASPKFFGGNNGYVRIGNGNQLVRDSKILTRILASEKVRWSLHMARSRLAKKKRYCQFFTRFGKCNKKGGKCPYIHDPSKVAICTKFLNDSCSNSDCKLTHKIIPERMPDCSYFLQGLCTNTSCPYRHVNVNPNASVCEGFLKGYCADGDECCKKHNYVCPIYQASGKCLQGSKCKLHHPKTKNKRKERNDVTEQGNTWGRYFGSGASESVIVSSDAKVEKKANDLLYNGRFAEFIALAPYENDREEYFMDSEDAAHPSHFESGDDALQNDDPDASVKPIRIMRKDYAALSSFPNGL